MLSQIVKKEPTKSPTHEFEVKYIFYTAASPLLESWIRFQCASDATYPVSRVQSIYLEDSDGTSYAEKINSDFYKTKYRVRWYEDPACSTDDEGRQTTVFLETKMKTGSQRQKARSTATVNLHDLRRHDLGHPFHHQWRTRFTDLGVDQYLEPYIQVSYIRKRFVEPMTGTRINLDNCIRVARSNPLLLPPPCIAELPMGVVEIKGNSPHPPDSLSYLTRNLARKTSFSKYERCVSLLLSS